MALFIDEAVDDKLSKKTTVIPKNIHNLVLKVKGEYGNNTTQDGYKTVNRLLDASYNKGKKKKDGISAKDDNEPKLDKKDGLVKFPTSAARKMVIDLKKEKNFIDPQAKQQIINYLATDVKSKESAVKNNNNVPQVPKLAKPPKAKQEKTGSPIKVGNANVNLHETKRKKIIIPESKLIILKEHKDQLNIPFNHDTENYDYKENWEHYIDFLEEYGKYGQLPHSQCDVSDVRDKIADILPNVLDELVGGEEGMYNELRQEDFIYEMLNDGYSEEYVSMEDFDDFNPEEMSADEYLRDFDTNDVFCSLNRTGEEAYEDYVYEFFKDRLGEYGFPYSLTYNDRGLIYVERAISVNGLMKRQKTNPFIGKYDSVGEYWTWDNGSSEPYCGGQGTTVTLKGWVDPSEVDWYHTLYVNMYDLNEEKELYIPNANVEIVSVTIYDGATGKDKSFGLQKPIIIKA